jgi:acyl carrier protein
MRPRRRNPETDRNSVDPVWLPFAMAAMQIGCIRGGIRCDTNVFVVSAADLYCCLMRTRMSDQNFAATISQTAQDVFRQSSIPYNPTLVFREIPGFDSILAIQFILAIESALDITLNEEEVDNMHTMGDLMTLLKAKKVS